MSRSGNPGDLDVHGPLRQALGPETSPFALEPLDDGLSARVFAAGDAIIRVPRHHEAADRQAAMMAVLPEIQPAAPDTGSRANRDDLCQRPASVWRGSMETHPRHPDATRPCRSFARRGTGALPGRAPRDPTPSPVRNGSRPFRCGRRAQGLDGDRPALPAYRPLTHGPTNTLSNGAPSTPLPGKQRVSRRTWFMATSGMETSWSIRNTPGSWAFLTGKRWHSTTRHRTSPPCATPATPSATTCSTPTPARALRWTPTFSLVATGTGNAGRSPGSPPLSGPGTRRRSKMASGRC